MTIFSYWSETIIGKILFSCRHVLDGGTVLWFTTSRGDYALVGETTTMKRTLATIEKSRNPIARDSYYLAPHRGRARYCNAHVCLFVCVFVCVFVCLFVCPCFRKISKCNISAISQPIIMKLGIHITP